MNLLVNIIKSLGILFGLLIFYPTAAQQTLDCEGVYGAEVSVPEDIMIPDTDVLSIDIRGGDGGGVKFGNPCNTHVQGGTGARVQVSYPVSETGDALAPGGTLRLYRGFRGGTREPLCISAGGELSGGGGGATAVLYLPPDGNATERDWILLAVAGGGGGATRPGPGNTDKVGKGAKAGMNGGSSGNSSGGSVSNCPETQFCLIGDNRQGIGAGLGCNETDDLFSYVGKDMVDTYTDPRNTVIYIKPKPNDQFIYTRGFGEGIYQEDGGFGLFGGGAPGKGGGGGGGFYGGAVYCQEGGGGGGSWVCKSFGYFDDNITAGVTGGAYHYPNHGTLEITTSKNPPVASCTPITLELDATGNTQFVKADYLANSSFPCGGTTTLSVTDINTSPLLGDIINFSCSDIGQTFNATVTVYDEQNTIIDQCNPIITVEDNIAPNVATNANYVLNLDASGNATLHPDAIDNSTDNCGIVSKTLSQSNFTCSDVGTKTVTLTVTDGAGNSSIADAVIQIKDFIAPNAQCKNITVPLDVTGNASITPADIDNGSSDACGISIMDLDQEEFNCTDVGDNTVTLILLDVNDNPAICEAIVTVTDDIAPEANCKDVSVWLDDTGNAYLEALAVNNGLSDVCGIANIEVDQTDFDCSHVGNSIVTLTVTDLNGNVASCNATVTVIDNTSPDIVCQDMTVYLDVTGEVFVSEQDYDNGSSDMCGIQIYALSQNWFYCEDIGANPIVYTVTDINGNSSSCNAIITVLDEIAPVAGCKNSVVEIQPDGWREIQLEDIYDAASSTDNCSIIGADFPATSYSCDEIGYDFTIPVTVSDLSGNTHTCYGQVTVVKGTNLPENWESSDLGIVTIGNEYSFDACTDQDPIFMVTGSGNNAIGTMTDHVAFAHQSLCGDGSITAKIESIDPNGYGGLMIRETSDAGAKQVSIFSNLTNILRHESRYTTNGLKQVNSFFKPTSSWLRLERQGDWIFAYCSMDGANFQYVHAVSVSMQSCVEIGLASFTYQPNQQTEAVFSNITISGDNSGFTGQSEGANRPSLNARSNGNAPTTNCSLLTVELFPNPSPGPFTIQFDKALPEDGVLTILNTMGQLIERINLKAGMDRVEGDLGQYTGGTYLLRIDMRAHVPVIKKINIISN